MIPGLFALVLLAGGAGAQAPAIRDAQVLPPDRVRVTLTAPLANTSPSNFRFTDQRAPDIPIELADVHAAGNVLTLVAGQKLSARESYRLEIHDPPLARGVRPSPWAAFLTVVLASALINNFVFTRYLGLCIFFGVSKKRETAIGMGITFAIIMLVTGMMSWALFTFVMSPLKLKFLQVMVFIGVVAFMVQMLDTILKKVNRPLHQKFGIYLVLITTNCIILAVPLLNAAGNATASEALALATGSGLGFALALFLMSCARERLELARVPESFKGLPIAFALAGLFALAFMGFSGLNFLR
jgi:electron transport complex protein RnfA